VTCRGPIPLPAAPPTVSPSQTQVPVGTPVRSAPDLTIELVPADQWGANLSQSLKGARWDVLRRETYRRAGYRCEVCGGIGEAHPVEAHEIWEYTQTGPAVGVQRLVRLIALCPACHQVKHFGLAQVNGRERMALAHLAAVNDWTLEEAAGHVGEAFSLWEWRNRLTWTLELGVLGEYGIEPPTVEEICAAVEASRARIMKERRW
jgi:5-methylcytosine-specific restriction endonuclease McrA